jgi:hypothetical protein
MIDFNNPEHYLDGGCESCENEPYQNNMCENCYHKWIDCLQLKLEQFLIPEGFNNKKAKELAEKLIDYLDELLENN